MSIASSSTLLGKRSYTKLESDQRFATKASKLNKNGPDTFNGNLIVAGTVSNSGETVTGTCNINASNNAATNIGTGTTTSNVSIGNSLNTVAIAGGTNNITGNAILSGQLDCNRQLKNKVLSLYDGGT